MFAFTSMGVDIDRSVNIGRGPYVFRINGVVHHRIGSLLPNEGDPAQYAQLYIHDTSNEVQNRLGIYSSETAHDDMPDPEIVQSLIAMLDECNPLVKQFRMARDRLLSPTAPDVSIRLVGTSDTSADRYSLSVVDELAALIVAGDSSVPRQFDIVVESRQSRLSISPLFIQPLCHYNIHSSFPMPRRATS